MRHTDFNCEKINTFLLNFKDPFAFSEVDSYEAFENNIPILSSEKLSELTYQLLDEDRLRSCTFSTTSGSAGVPKVLVNAHWRDKNPKNYAKDFREHVEKNMLSQTDTVANIFTPGGISTLYDGCNRLLEAIGTNVIPVGRIDFFKNQEESILTMLSKMKANVLFGTPVSVMQCLLLTKKFNIKLNINKIVFTGEPFSQQKINSIKRHWPTAQFYGLYGHSETGFVGFNGPQCRRHQYHLIEDWFLTEVSAEGEIFITSLASTVLPIVRYSVGDYGKLVQSICACGNTLPLLELAGRCDKKFKFSGNLISAYSLVKTVQTTLHQDLDIQVQLENDIEGKDILSIVIDLALSEFNAVYHSLEKTVLIIDGIAECMEKGVGEIKLLPRNHFIFSARQKLPMVIDSRGGYL